MNEVIILKYGEIVLKGLNRSSFEDVLIKNIRRRLSSIGEFKIVNSQSTAVIWPKNEDADIDTAYETLQKVYGVVSLSRALAVEKDFDKIKAEVPEYVSDVLSSHKTFKVDARRSDKKFPLNSPQICVALGEVLLDKFPNVSVDVNSPEVVVMVEIRDTHAFIHADKTPGAGGLPVGCGGKAALLLSGGIDSPVAGCMMAKRGLEICAIHFESPPYTSERAKMKVFSLAKKMSAYCGRIEVFVVPFTKVQESIREKCPEELFTVIMRRYMMKISQKIAQKNGCQALITGESLGQVASQTVQAISCTDAVCSMPILRPLIGMDKTEIVDIARKIDTFETSILPYEDCCTVFTPRHPRTRPKETFVLSAESKLDEETLVSDCLDNVTSVVISQF
ncbi:MAG: tRNA 4-thiouridine(8) synthase ThiI [Oscillospiraceae bacterium]|nr:tRNA 4-thiouridine(8) synthase ThiI [Oscillospiraceae bacterium]